MFLRKVIKIGSFYLASNLISKAIGFISVIAYTQLLSPAEFGQFDYIIAIGAIVGVLVPLEVGQSIQRYYTSHEKFMGSGDPIVSNSIIITLLMFIPFGLIAVLANYFLNFTSQYMLLSCLLMYFLNSQIYILSSVFVAKNYSKNHAKCTIFNQIISVLTSLLILKFLQLGAVSIVIGQSAGSILTILLYNREFRKLDFSWSQNTIKTILNFSVPLVPSSLGVLGMLYIDRIMLEHFLGMTELGKYGIAVRVAAISLIPIMALRMTITPLIYQNIENKELKDELAKNLLRYLITAVTITIIAVHISPSIINILFSSDYSDSHEPINILVASFFISNAYIFYPGMVIKEKTQILTAVNLLGLLTNIPLNYLLIPELGSNGAASATLLSSVFTLTIHSIASEKLFKAHKWYLPKLCCIWIFSFVLVFYNIQDVAR